MKIKIKQRELSKHINIVQKSISSRTTMQILDGILLEAKKDKLKLTGTDLELSIESFVDCEIIEEGSIVVNSRIFGDIIKKLENDLVTITVDKTNINIKCENSEFNISGNSGEDYPDLPLVVERDSFNIPMDIFKTVIKKTVFATTADETRPTLTGVLVEIENRFISFIALDGYRLAFKRLPINTDANTKMIIPGRSLNEINKILEEKEEDLNISVSPSHIIVNLGSTTIYSRLLEGPFFNYKDIIRKEHKTIVKVKKQELQNSLERASLLAKEEKANLVKLSLIDNTLNIKSNTEVGNVFESIDAQADGEDVNIAFNSRYIIEGIKAIDDEEIKLNFMGSLNPCIINGLEDEDYTYLVLPVRLAQDDF
ncbi:DNA polymerase III subunit beta [Tissierella creatinophila]|uniref:Beta sliding clamp n=1 Tax=Tissierella creatinophila DSM 6911 TaxID=1123403 RepID=A0A1U7M635_TISCR|nr:DNA polymerase III subunit beta [Tissierella creatinophila]OLS02720.1 DNA polymerase III subunit beta [Tissierella creatinophila DSM 6911]